MKFSLILFIFILSSLSSCASWKPNYEFCQRTNWEKLGVIDAKADRPLEGQFSRYKNMCKSFDEPELTPNFVLYRHGHYLGVKSYCTFEQGRKNALKEDDFTINCKREDHPEFFKGIEQGKKEFCVYDRGYQTGFQGHVSSKSCLINKHTEFYQGIKSGIKQYCQYESGKREGKKGREYTGNCSTEQEREFLKGHAIGQSERERVLLKREVSDLKIEIGIYRQKITNLEYELNEKEDEIYKLQKLLAKKDEEKGD